MNRLFSFLLLMSFVSLSLNAQSAAKKNRMNAWKKIDDLKNGVVLFRLNTSQNKIDHLKKLNKGEEAEAVRKKQEQRNKDLMKGFAEYFDFCPVYFYSSKNAIEIRNGDYSKLFDAQGERVNVEIIELPFIGAFKTSHADTEFNGASPSTVVILNTDYRPLNYPFPHFGEYWSPFFEKERSAHKKMEFLVGNLNKKLHRFYTRTNKKRSRGNYQYYLESLSANN